MSADILRRAATLLKHSAGAAQYGPWVADTTEIYREVPGGTWVGETLDIEDPKQGEANANYIVLMHPPVALALAAWLESEAQWSEGCGGIGFSQHAVTLARVILREAPTGAEIDGRLSEGPSFPGGGIQL